jgi:Xaa-Pro aminopeptidase
LLLAHRGGHLGAAFVEYPQKMSPTDRFSSLGLQKDFSAAELTGRRKRLASGMQRGIAVIASATEVAGFEPFRQVNDFYYLTGVQVPHSYLLIDCAAETSTLYLAPRDDQREKANGPCLSADDASLVLQATGIEQVRPISDLVQDLTNLPLIWTIRSPSEGSRQCQDTLRHHVKSIHDDPLDGRPTRELHLLTRLARLSPRADFRDLSHLIHRQRLIKSPAEIAVMRRAGRLAALACTEAMKATVPGIFEFQLGAIADYLFQINGAQGAGYAPIIATGDNIWLMHYWRNNRQLAANDLVLFDYAPDLNGYTSDIGRMWPVTGRFSATQRELYSFVLQHHKTLLSLIGPGKTKEQVLAQAAEILRPVADSREWSKPIYKAGALNLLASSRPLSHGVGMPVHESTNWADDPIETGLVFAVDPELVIPEEQLYIRVEDTVVVTETGIENLTAACPSEIEEIEATVTGRGMLQSIPAEMISPGR